MDTHFSLHCCKACSLGPLCNNTYVFHQLVALLSFATASTLRDVTLQRAEKLWETQQAPANHVNASQRMTFPDASVFPLH